MADQGYLVPPDNLAVYKILYNIEAGLRELIVDTLQTKFGPRWWKQRLPGDVLSSFKEGRTYQMTVKWSRLVPHHPIYYVQFTDLQKVMRMRANWTDVFREVFGREEVLTGHLTTLEPIRNHIAHNRKVSSADLAIVEGVYQALTTSIGAEHFNELASRCTLADDIPTCLSELRAEAEDASTLCVKSEPIEQLSAWHRVDSSWWFDDDYLGASIDGIRDFFRALDEYAEFPRTRGTGHMIEAWVSANRIEAKSNRAVLQLDALLSQARKV